MLAPATGSSVQDQLEALGEESLRCTGCEMIADALYASLDSKIAKSFKGWNTDERVANVGKAMRMDGAAQTCCRLPQRTHPATHQHHFSDALIMFTHGTTSLGI